MAIPAPTGVGVVVWGETDAEMQNNMMVLLCPECLCHLLPCFTWPLSQADLVKIEVGQDIVNMEI